MIAKDRCRTPRRSSAISGWRLMPSKAAIREVHASSADAVRTAERCAAILWAAARKVLGVRAAMLKQLSQDSYKKASPQTLRLLLSLGGPGGAGRSEPEGGQRTEEEQKQV